MKYSLLPLAGLTLAALLTLGAGCASSVPTTDTNISNNAVTPENNNALVTTDTTNTLDQEFDLKVGQTALVTDTNVEVQLASVSNDSRCPEDAQCITAGNVTIELNVAVNGTSETTAVTGSGNSELPAMVEVLGYRITMLGVTPLPKTGETLAAEDYTVTLKVSSTGTATTTPAQ